MIELNIPKELEQKIQESFKDRTAILVRGVSNGGLETFDPNLGGRADLFDYLQMNEIEIAGSPQEIKDCAREYDDKNGRVIDYLLATVKDLNALDSTIGKDDVRNTVIYETHLEKRLWSLNDVWKSRSEKQEKLLEEIRHCDNITGLQNKPEGLIDESFQELSEEGGGGFTIGPDIDVHKAKKELIAIELLSRKYDRSHGYIMIGASGSGKSSLITQISGIMSNIKQLRKVTTRPERNTNLSEGTVHVSRAEFESLMSDDKLVGGRIFDGNYYSHLKQDIEEAIEGKTDLIFDSSDPHSVQEIKRAYPGYFKIVGIGFQTEQVIQNLIGRYGTMSNNEIVAKTRERRIFHVRNYGKTMKFIEKISDFMIPDDYFVLKQKYLRDYILQQRFGEGRVI